MDNAAIDAAYVLMLLVGSGAALAGIVVGLLIGYARWGRQTTYNKPLVTGLTEDEIPQLFPARDPLTWDHLPVPTEPEQAL